MRGTSSVLGALALVSCFVLTGCGGGGGTTVVAAPELPGTFALVSPVPEAADTVRQPLFTWQPSPRAGAYTLTVADNPDLTDPVVSDIGIVITSRVLTTPLPGSTTWWWRVTAVNAAGETACTADGTFTTGTLAPPVILSQFRSCTLPVEGGELTVTATGALPLTYRWQIPVGDEWWTLSEDGEGVLTIPSGATQFDGLQLRCIVTNADGEATTSAETLRVRRVVRVTVDGTGDGSSWDQAANLHALIGLFSHDHDGMLFPNRPDTDEIWVAEGTFHSVPESESWGWQISFQIPAGVGLYGGFAGTEAVRVVEGRDTTTHRTVLDGRSPDFTHVAAHTVTFGDHATLDGITVRGGFFTAAFGCLTPYAFEGDQMIYGPTSTGITVHDCVFEGSTISAGFDGRGLDLSAGSRVTDCIVTGYPGDGIRGSGTFTNCIVAANGGAGMVLDDDSTVVNCTITENGGDQVACYDDLVVVGSVVWPGSSSGLGIVGRFTDLNPAPVVTVTHSCVSGGPAGTGNIDADPLFVDALGPLGADVIFGTGDDGLRLQAGSPCIDAADGTTAPVLDVTGQTRWDDPAVTDTGSGTAPVPDMGAYEYRGE